MSTQLHALDRSERRREQSCSYRDWNSDSPAFQSVSRSYTDCSIHEGEISDSYCRIGWHRNDVSHLYLGSGKFESEERLSWLTNLSDYMRAFLSPFLYCSTVLLMDLGYFVNFLIFYTVSRTPWTADQPVARPLPTDTTTQNRINAHRHPCL
jgi:hypothetical protein